PSCPPPESQPPTVVGARAHGLDPVAVLEVPANGLLHARAKALPRPPAQLRGDPARVDGIAEVVAGAVGHEGDLVGVAPAIRTGRYLVENFADRVDHLQVGALGVATDVVGAADGAAHDD